MESVPVGKDAGDPLGLYLREARGVPLLTAAEERDLARAYRRETRDESSREASRRDLLEHNLRLVVAVAKRYANMGLELADLVQEGNLGLMQAVDRFNPELGVRFSTYAVWWIRQAITRALTSKSRTIRVPIHQRELAQKALRLAPALRSNGDGEHDLGRLAEATGVPLSRLQRALSTLVTMQSLDAPAIDGGSLRGELIADERAFSPFRAALEAEKRTKVRELLGALSSREEAILRMRFAIDYPEERTLEQIGAEVHLTRERVRQLERDALRRLRREAERRGLRGLLAD